MDDTTPEMAEKMRELIRAKSPIERLKMGSSMHETSRRLIIDAILRENPDISPAELRKELFLSFDRDDFSPEEREKILEELGKVNLPLNLSR